MSRYGTGAGASWLSRCPNTTREASSKSSIELRRTSRLVARVTLAKHTEPWAPSLLVSSQNRVLFLVQITALSETALEKKMHVCELRTSSSNTAYPHPTRLERINSTIGRWNPSQQAR